jgi:hypothetical protein
MAGEEKDTFTETGLKSTLKPSPLEEILRCRYKYISADNRYYILAIYERGLTALAVPSGQNIVMMT